MDSGHFGLRRQLQKYFFPLRAFNSKRSVQTTSRTTPTTAINASQLPGGDGMTLASQPQHPTILSESLSLCINDGCSSLPTWGSSGAVAQSVSMPQELYPVTTTSSNDGFEPLDGFRLNDFSDQWMQKPFQQNFDLDTLDPDTPIGQAYVADETVPMLDLGYADSSQNAVDQFNLDGNIPASRMSGSSFTVSTSERMSDMPSYEEFSAAFSEMPPFNSDYLPASNRTSLMSSTQLSPVASPRLTPQSRTEQVRAQSRGRASPSPRPSMRSAPYSIDTPRSVKRWSTGSYGATQRRSSPIVYPSSSPDNHTTAQRISLQSLHPPLASGILPSSLSSVPMKTGNFTPGAHSSFVMSGASSFQRNSMILPSQLPSQLPPQLPAHFFHHHDGHGFPQPPTLPSNGFLPVLQSNGDQRSLTSCYTDNYGTPDLFAALLEEQDPPPPEDINPANPDLAPFEQELRFEGDLYTPRWVRGQGNRREGWCGFCKPGRWLVLKNSAFWYDKSFSHGVSAATGAPFQEPVEARRMKGNPDVWEGLCGNCGEWLPLVSSKKKGTTWFRHAYKCHGHPKVKDAAKRRRDNSRNRGQGQAPSAMSESKTDSQQRPTPPPQVSTPSASQSADSKSSPRMQKQQRIALVPPPLRLCSAKSRATHLLSPVDSCASMT